MSGGSLNSLHHGRLSPNKHVLQMDNMEEIKQLEKKLAFEQEQNEMKKKEVMKAKNEL